MARENAFRNDVQGIRTIGALLVATFHIWVGGVSGGVDVFFVVSGYFLGIGFLREDGKGKQVGIIDHYQRFLCRIAPPALIALLGITVLIFVFISRASWENQLREVAASALYVENWWLIKKGQDYLQRGADLSLVQHFWAVSLIGQVQLLWPILVAVALKLARLFRSSGATALATVLAIAALASFANSLFATATRPDSAYFDLSTRYWQFAIGALVGLHPGLRNSLSPTISTACSWLGLGLLVSCGFAIGSTAHFPGYASLWPVTAAVLILLGGRENNSANAGYWLASRPLSTLGNYSFGIYLWHWPLLAVLLTARPGGQPSVLMGVGIIAAAAALAFITKRIVDGANLFASITIRAGLFAGVVLVLAAGAEGGNRFIRHLGTQQLAGEMRDTTLHLVPSAFAAHKDLPGVYDSKCHQVATQPTPTHCAFGDEAAPFTVFLVGGSHSTHWLPALQEIAKQRHWRIISMTKSSCIFADFSDAELLKLEDPDPSCLPWNDAAMAEIIRIRPDLVVTIASRMVFSGPTHKEVLSEQIPDGYVRHFNVLLKEKIPVVAIRDTPWMSRDIPNCVYASAALEQNCSGLRSDVLEDASFQQALARLPQGVALVDMTDAFCSDTQCDVIRDGILMYRDSHHITTTYARALSPLLAERITQSLGQVKSNSAISLHAGEDPPH